jgi:hypothetical protein|tara:strand:- start:2944 stop:3408 length:465 start_codon:yes stop_codon:yes gene_type:complete
MITQLELAQLERLGKKATAASKSLPFVINDIKKDAAYHVWYKVTLGTLVDTSKALSNWKISTPVDNPIQRPAYFLGGTEVGEVKGSTKSQSFQLAQRIEFANVQRAQPEKAVYISTNLDYVREIYEGGDHFHKIAKVAAESIIAKNSKQLKNII